MTRSNANKYAIFLTLRILYLLLIQVDCFRGNNALQLKIKMEENEGVRCDIHNLYLFSFLCVCSTILTRLFFREERQEFDFTASEEAIAYLGNISRFEICNAIHAHICTYMYKLSPMDINVVKRHSIIFNNNKRS